MARILITLLLALSASLNANADSIQVLGYSYHFDRSDNWCEDNPGLGYTSSSGYSLIGFSNSLCNWTVFANYYKPLVNWGALEFGTRAGVFWSEDTYILGWDAGPAVTLEMRVFDTFAVSFLYEALSLHYHYKF